MTIHTIEADTFQFINQSIDYITGNDEGATERGETINPTHVGLRPDMTVTLTTGGFNTVLNLQAPFPQKFVWEVPKNPRRWRNSDLSIFGFLLSLAPLRFRDPDSEVPMSLAISSSDELLPLPSDFVTGIAHDNGGQMNEDAFKTIEDMLPDVALALPETGNAPGDERGFSATLFRDRYHGLAAQNLENRERVLTWRNLRTIKRRNGKVEGLGAPIDPSRIQLTARQDGFVSPSVPRPTTTTNAVITAQQTSYQAVNADFDVPITVNDQDVRVPATTTLAEIEEDFGIDVFRIFRRLPEGRDTGFIPGLRAASNAYRDGEASGDIGPVGDGAQTGLNLVLFDLDLGHRERDVEDLRALNILPDPTDRERVLQQILVAKHDRYDVY